MSKTRGDNPMGKWTRDLSSYITKVNIQTVSACERCSYSLIIREMHNKATVRCYYTPTRMTVVKKIDYNKCE